MPRRNKKPVEEKPAKKPSQCPVPANQIVDLTKNVREEELLKLEDLKDGLNSTKEKPAKKLAKIPPKPKESTTSQCLGPASYPNQVVAVKKHVRQNELSKLTGLKEDLQNNKEKPAKKLAKIPPKPKESTTSQCLGPASYPNQVVAVKKHFRQNELSKLTGLKEDLQNNKEKPVKKPAKKLAKKPPKPEESTTSQCLGPASCPNQVVNVKTHVRKNVLSKLTGLEEDLQNKKEKPVKKPAKKPQKKPQKKPPKPEESTTSQCLVSTSYPNQVVDVKKHVRENELSKLNGLEEDLQNNKEKPAKKPPKPKEITTSQTLVSANQIVYVTKNEREEELLKLEDLKNGMNSIKYLLENMKLDAVPSARGILIKRLSEVEQMIRMQGSKVAHMVVKPYTSTAENMKELTWDAIQKASDAVQPRIFGVQAMAAHNEERNMILQRLRDLHVSLGSRPSDSQQAPHPRNLRSTLMQHQLQALAWLRWRETQSPCGGILADDMGLGKTITMISLIADDNNKLDDGDDCDDDYVDEITSKLARGGTLVVCPASLMQQWRSEVTTHCTPHAISVCLHHGADRTVHPHRLAIFDIILTTYNLLQRDYKKNGVLTKILWRRIILDEAHVARNPQSTTSKAVCALHGRRRWCLTGTPVHNKDTDLLPLLKFLRCTPFDDLAMWQKWIADTCSGGHERLNIIMSCVMLRRTKIQLQQNGQLNCLPERTTHIKEITLSTEEMNVYQKVLLFSKSLLAQFLDQRAEREDDESSSEKEDGDSSAETEDGELIPLNKEKNTYDEMLKKMVALQGAKPIKSHQILVLLLRLRQICCHCGLIAGMLDKAADDVAEEPDGQDLVAKLNRLSLDDFRNWRKDGQQEEDCEEESEEEYATVTEAIRSVVSPNNPVFQLDRQSSKIRAVMDCLKTCVLLNPGHKAVVVSQWTSLLHLVEMELVRERIQSVTLSGKVRVPARTQLIQALNDPKSNVTVMLLSLCAGGVGLNLCGANHLLLLDPHWNPQLEEQAQDRIYRVGQTKDVHIYRFLCVNTVEHTIRKLQQAKLELAEAVLTGATNQNTFKLSIEELKMLFNME